MYRKLKLPVHTPFAMRGTMRAAAPSALEKNPRASAFKDACSVHNVPAPTLAAALQAAVTAQSAVVAKFFYTFTEHTACSFNAKFRVKLVRQQHLLASSGGMQHIRQAIAAEVARLGGTVSFPTSIERGQDVSAHYVDCRNNGFEKVDGSEQCWRQQQHQQKYVAPAFTDGFMLSMEGAEGLLANLKLQAELCPGVAAFICAQVAQDPNWPQWRSVQFIGELQSPMCIQEPLLAVRRAIAAAAGDKVRFFESVEHLQSKDLSSLCVHKEQLDRWRPPPAPQTPTPFTADRLANLLQPTTTTAAASGISDTQVLSTRTHAAAATQSIPVHSEHSTWLDRYEEYEDDTREQSQWCSTCFCATFSVAAGKVPRGSAHLTEVCSAVTTAHKAVQYAAVAFTPQQLQCNPAEYKYFVLFIKARSSIAMYSVFSTVGDFYSFRPYGFSPRVWDGVHGSEQVQGFAGQLHTRKRPPTAPATAAAAPHLQQMEYDVKRLRAENEHLQQQVEVARRRMLVL